MIPFNFDQILLNIIGFIFYSCIIANQVLRFLNFQSYKCKTRACKVYVIENAKKRSIKSVVGLPFAKKSSNNQNCKARNFTRYVSIMNLFLVSYPSFQRCGPGSTAFGRIRIRLNPRSGSGSNFSFPRSGSRKH